MSKSETIEATVDRIKFSSSDTGWAVLGMLQGRKRFVAVGDLADVEPGEALELQGKWTQNGYGLQFKTANYRKVRPSSAEGILRFLASINGVGFRTAHCLVSHWGAETLEKLEQGPEAARAVPGIGPGRAPAIYQAVVHRTRRDNVLMELQSLGVGAALAAKVLRQVGEESALGWIRADPYQLRTFDGVGFLTADRVAGRLGFQSHDPRRLDAGIIHALEEAALAGHCCLPPDELAAAASKLLEVRKDLLPPRFDRLRDAGELRSFQEHLYLTKLWYAEKDLAERVRVLLSQPAGEVPYLEDPDGVVLSDEQREAVELALKSKVFILTGGPGTGKTTITRAIVRSLLAGGLKLELASPTGRAAQRLQEATDEPAATIHRLLQYHPAEGFRIHRDNPLECDVLIVDEVSMLDVFLARRLLDAVKDTCRIIFVGDADQLPSVGPGRVLRDMIDSGTVPTARLRRIFRQAEASHIVRSAHRINRGELPEGGADPKTDDLFITATDKPELAAKILVEYVADRIPKVMGFNPQTEVQILVPMKKGVLGTHELNRRLRDLLNPHGRRIGKAGRFRVGDRVMQIRNNYTHWSMNGETGQIVDYDEKERSVLIDFSEGRKTYSLADLGELELAYACTIHKSQGSEYPCVVIALHRYHHVLLQRDLFYTALTRARKLAVLVGDMRSIRRAVRTVGGNSRFTGLARRLQHTTQP